MQITKKFETYIDALKFIKDKKLKDYTLAKMCNTIGAGPCGFLYKLEYEEKCQSENMPKLSELNNGAVVETRNGKRYLKVDNTLLDLSMTGVYSPIDYYDSNLCHKGNQNFDIVKINNDAINSFGCANKAVYEIQQYKWTWERKEEQYYNGKVVCVDNCLNKSDYTVGKIYEFKDGRLTTDKYNMFPFNPIHNFKEWEKLTPAKFIEIVE